MYNTETLAYIINFLAGFSVFQSGIVYYGKPDNIPAYTKITIVPAFSDFNDTSIPEIPFQAIDNVPILFGVSKIEKQNGSLIIHADIIASSFYLLSRYEELLKPNNRDSHGRFLAKDSVIFQQGFGNRPLVDEYGVLLRKWLREAGVNVPEEKRGFNKIYLTHDVDNPFHFENLWSVFKQYIKNILRRNYCASPFKKYLNETEDDYYTFPKIIDYDNSLRGSIEIPVECIYFLISAGSLLNRKYYNFFSRKTDFLIKKLSAANVTLGLHISYEAGINPEKIQYEARRFKEKTGIATLVSRHHFLQWREPEDAIFLEQAGITDDFSLSYADNVGFRTGTCHPHFFINPRTKKLTSVIIHPLDIMECSLESPLYMNLDFENAFSQCKDIIDQVYKHNGDLVLLWHNTEFTGKNYQEKLYKKILEYIRELA